jgi:hypothetical protein
MELVGEGLQDAEQEGSQHQLAGWRRPARGDRLHRPPLGLGRQQRPANKQTEDDVFAQLSQPAEQIVGEEGELR